MKFCLKSNGETFDTGEQEASWPVGAGWHDDALRKVYILLVRSTVHSPTVYFLCELDTVYSYIARKGH